jgi:hypothetical protein
MFITVFTRALHWSVSWARLIQSIPPHPTSLRSILILHFYLRIPSSHFPSGFPTKTLYVFLYFHSCYKPCPPHPHSVDNSNYNWSRAKVTKIFIAQVFHQLHSPNKQTNLLTPWIRVFLQDPIIAQLDGKFLEFYETLRFITMITWILHWSVLRQMNRKILTKQSIETSLLRHDAFQGSEGLDVLNI